MVVPLAVSEGQDGVVAPVADGHDGAGGAQVNAEGRDLVLAAWEGTLLAGHLILLCARAGARPDPIPVLPGRGRLSKDQ